MRRLFALALGLVAGLAAAQGFPYARLATDAVTPVPGQVRSILERLCEPRLWPGLHTCSVEGEGADSSLYLEARDGVSGYVLENLLYGSFTGRGREEALAELFFNLGDGGGSDAVLLRRSGGVYRPVRVYRNLAPGECLKFAGSDGRDRLACLDAEYEGPGGGSPFADDFRSALRALTLSDSGASEAALLRTPLTNVPDCDNTPPFFAVAPLSWARRDWDRDGRPDLIVEFGEARVSPPAGYRCAEGREPGSPPQANVRVALPAPKVTRLVYLFTGTGFRPTPGTGGLARALERARR